MQRFKLAIGLRKFEICTCFIFVDVSVKRCISREILFSQCDDFIRVGASAACLAATSFDSQSHSTQFSSAMSQENWKGALDPEKAEELDNLIQAGDWEGKLSSTSCSNSSLIFVHRLLTLSRDFILEIVDL